jgi:hypothetical protein
MLTKTIRRKVVTLRGEMLMLELAPEGIRLRQPRRRTAFVLPYETAFLKAIRLQVDADNRNKKPRKLARTLRRGV